MNTELLVQLRNDLDSAEYRLDTIRTRIGHVAEAARHRGVFTPARRALQAHPSDALADQVRLLLFGDVLSADEIDAAFPQLGAPGALSLGLIIAHGEGFRVAVSLNPVELPDPRETDRTMHWRILSDLDDQLRGGPAKPHHVMGIGGATRSLLAQASLGLPEAAPSVQRALDLGTGCGIVALYLAAAGIAEVVGSDISERALEFARANTILNETHISRAGSPTITFVQGSLFEPFAGERFDLILSNPPFVITPRRVAAVPSYEYRDAGLTGDALAQAVIENGPAYLTDGGTLLCLANWETPWGGDGLERVSSWVQASVPADSSCAAWVIERDRVEPAQYAETWVRDGGARTGTTEFETLMDAWLTDFTERRIVAIGLGSIRVQRGGFAEGQHFVRAEQVMGAIASTPGEALARVFEQGIRTQSFNDTEILSTHWHSDPALREIREHTPGSESPHTIVLRIEAPLERVVTADTLLAAAVGVCDGDLSLSQISGALAQLLEVDAEAVAEALIPEVRELVWLGMLTSAER